MLLRELVHVGNENIRLERNYVYAVNVTHIRYCFADSERQSVSHLKDVGRNWDRSDGTIDVRQGKNAARGVLERKSGDRDEEKAARARERERRSCTRRYGEPYIVKERERRKREGIE